MPKTVLFLNLYTFSLTGGIEKVSRNFMQALNQLGSSISSKTFSLYDQNKDFDPRYGAAQTYQAFAGNKFLFLLKSLIQAKRTDIIVLSHINLLAIAWLVAKIYRNKRIVLMAHGIEVWRNLSAWKVNFMKQQVEFWAVSQYTKNQLVVKHGIDQHKIYVLHNCLSPFFNPNKLGTDTSQLANKHQLNVGTKVIFTLNRLSSSEKYKGYDKVIAALAQLKKTRSDFVYLLAGKADSMEEERIKSLIHQHQLEREVQLVGYVDDNDIDTYFALCDLFIMPSKGEGFGIVFIEAAAAGCQVIGGGVDGSVDALLNGELGQLVNPDDEQSIINALQYALDTPNHNRKTQQEKTLASFSFEQYREKVKGLL